jgi:hypothetical protein
LSEIAGTLYKQRQEFNEGDSVARQKYIVVPGGNKRTVILGYTEDFPYIPASFTTNIGEDSYTNKG